MILKKPKVWDFKKPNFFAYLLYPFTIFVEINNIISTVIPKKKFINKYIHFIYYGSILSVFFYIEDFIAFKLILVK